MIGSNLNLLESQAALVELLVTGHTYIALHHPDKLFDGVIEVQAEVTDCTVFGNSERGGLLYLLNQLLVSAADEAPTFIDIQEDVVTPELNIQLGRIYGLVVASLIRIIVVVQDCALEH